MSATNHTTNYNLPQFIGTDKPTWLTDVNGALSAIDTQMKANADSATSADTKATTAQTAVGTLSNLSTTDKTSAVGAINEVNTAVGTAQGTANSANTTATNANDKATLALANTAKMNLTSFVTTQASNFSNVVKFTNLGGSLTVATNSDGSVFKLYGTITFNKQFGDSSFKFASAIRPTSNITISGVGFFVESTGYLRPFDATIETDGTVTIANYAGDINGANGFFPNCLYFAKDFGDTPTPQA